MKVEKVLSHLNEGRLLNFIAGAAAGFLASKSPLAAGALLVTAGTYDQIVKTSETNRKKLRIVSQNAPETRANQKLVLDLIRKHGYTIDKMSYLPNGGREWDMVK
jgi:hypothetical protein